MIPPRVTGIIHAGAHEAEEFEQYRAAGVTHTLWIEPQFVPFSRMVERLRKEPGQTFRNVALGPVHARMPLRIASNGQSSSLLLPAKHLTDHPSVTFSHVEMVDVVPLDHLAFETYDRSAYSMLVMDCQGYELEVLEGGEETLWGLEWVSSEIARSNLYEGQVQFPELNAWMRGHGFELMNAEWWPGSDEGEALWRRKR